MLKRVFITLAVVFMLAPLLKIEAYDKDSLVVIVSKNSKIEKIDLNLLRDIFLGKTKFIKDNIKAILGFREEEKLHETFCHDLIGTSPLEFKKNWAKRIFAGTNIAPSQIRGDDNEVKKWVTQNPNGISYILEKNIDDTVKVISDRLDGKK